MVQRTPKYRPPRMNTYVPACGYAADIIIDGPLEVKFGPMVAADTNSVFNAVSIAADNTATPSTAMLITNLDAAPAANQPEFPYGLGFGRTLVYVASGASTATITARGRDYLGQPMTEVATLNGTTPVQGKKAFRYIDSVSWTAGGAVTMSIGRGAKLGLPYRMHNVLEEMLDGVRVATLGTLTTPDRTDPQTTTTGDPRGLYAPQSTLNGTAFLTAVFQHDRSLNAVGNGGLYGMQHFYS